ncbi:MAG: hypothetical protein GQ531_10145, partial [Sulfurovum sp.]|nr:hypothetical protein [Sulfurovum sp.]
MKLYTLFYTAITLLLLTACGGGSSTNTAFVSTDTVPTVQNPTTLEPFAISQTINIFENTSRAIILQGTGSVFVIETQPLHG